MADAHDKLCEEADVGSLCDCSCAGSKHAIRHTKGGVPGAGAVSKAAQAAAHKDGRAAVINNRAVPKEGSKVSSSAPKSFRDAKPGPGKPEPGKPAGKPISMMSNLSGHTDEELKAAHAAIEAKIGPQGGISGPQRDIQQKIERELAVRGRPLPGNRPDTRGKPVFKGGDAETAKALKGGGNVLDERAAARTKAKFGDATEVTRENTKEGDRVTHVREGKGTVERVGKFGAMSVKFDNGGTKPVMPHEMVKGEHGAGEGTGPARLQLKPGAVQLSGTAPEAGTRVVHEQFGAGTIAAKGHPSQPALVQFDSPAAGKRAVERHTLFDAADVVGHDGKAPDKAGTAAKPSEPAAAKVPAALRDINAVIDNPSAHQDTAAAARYQKLTREHMAQMSPEQKQKMLDDVRSRASSYKPNSPTGQKLARAYGTLTTAGSAHKAGMQASMANKVHAGDQVTHAEHGHGKVKSTVYGGDGATVDFGDKSVQVPHGSLTFGHVAGADTNTAAKAQAGRTADAARQKANGEKLLAFAGNPTITEFNKVSDYPPEAFKALSPANQSAMVDALHHLFDHHGATAVKQRVSATLEKWTGTPRKVDTPAASGHVADALDLIEGRSKSKTLPTSMVYGQLSRETIAGFTPEQRAKLKDHASQILAKMGAKAPDRPGLERVVRDVDGVDADAASAGPRLQPGDVADGKRVTHPQFGAGTIRGSQGSRGGPVQVEFDQGHAGLKTRYVNHATELHAERKAGKQMTVTSRRRNGDASTEQVAKPARRSR